MAISKNTQTNIDDSDLANYPNGQVKDDSGTGDGFPLERTTVSDIFEFFDKLMRLAAITFNGTFDNVTNGYQLVAAAIALASKSDYILPITSVTDILQITTNLDILQLNEKLICQASADWVDETQIKGTTATLLTVTITRNYKAGDYLMLIRTSGGVKLIDLVTSDNINLIISENAYLKAASNAITLTGTAVNTAVTPASLLNAFQQRLNNATYAAPFYATDSLPGLMSAADKTALDGFSSTTKNTGSFTGLDAGGGTVGAFLTPYTGNVTAAQITAVDGSGSWTRVRVTVANAMTGTAYFVRMAIQSAGTMSTDVNIQAPVFTPVSTTQFDVMVQQGTSGGVQNLKIHCEVVQI